MAIPTVTISRFRWAVRPLTFLPIKGINHFTGGFCLRLLVIYNPALRLSRCHSNAPALWPRPLFGSKGNRQERERRYFVLRILPLTYLYPQIHMQSPQNFLSTLLPATSELIPPWRIERNDHTGITRIKGPGVPEIHTKQGAYRCWIASWVLSMGSWIAKLLIWSVSLILGQRTLLYFPATKG